MRNLSKEDRERNDGRASVELETALALIARGVPPIDETERSPLAESLGRVLSEDIRAEGDLPPFDRSPLDGYALRSADTRGAAPNAPVVLSVTDTVYAGRRGDVAVIPGTAVRLMTGAPIPEGADCVVPFERVEESGESIRLSQPLQCHENYCFRGEDIRAGAVAARAGARVDARSIGVLASSGLATLPVFRRPRVAVFSTGDELVPPDAPMGPGLGKIRDSNSLTLDFALRELLHGLTPRNLGCVPDDAEHVAELIRGLSDCDLIVTSGGVSTGDKDIFHDVFDRLGVRTIFRRVRVKPGTPVMVVQMGRTVLAALSGNPFAMFVNLQLFVRPILAALTGDTGLLLREGEATMENAYPKASKIRRFLRASLHGSCVCAPKAGQDSPGRVANTPESDVLIDIPAGSQGLRAGDSVRIWHIR